MEKSISAVGMIVLCAFLLTGCAMTQQRQNTIGVTTAFGCLMGYTVFLVKIVQHDNKEYNRGYQDGKEASLSKIPLTNFIRMWDDKPVIWKARDSTGPYAQGLVDGFTENYPKWRKNGH